MAVYELANTTMPEGQKRGCCMALLSVHIWVRSYLSAFSQFQSILHVNAQITDRAVDFGMTE